MYAAALQEFGRPRQLSGCEGWLLERPIAGFANYSDATGCYPLFACLDWSALRQDLQNLADPSPFVSLVLVADPFGDYSLSYLHECFNELVLPFKQHFVISLDRPLDRFVDAQHRYKSRKALRGLKVERCVEPLQFLNDWIELYANLVSRHQITGIAAFSPASFAQQLQVPGLIVMRASLNELTVGMVLWYIQNGVGYYHLNAYSEAGYRLGASFALMWYALQYFQAMGLKWLNLGAGAGLKQDPTNGLSRFKQGWSTDTRTAYLCGRVFEQDSYYRLTEITNTTKASYFPAYRQGNLD